MKDDQEKLIIIIAAMSQLLAQFVANMATVAIPYIAADLHLSGSVQNWINIMYLISVVAFTIPFSKVISNYGAKRSTIFATVMIIVSLVMSAFSYNHIMLFLSRFIQGISVAALLLTIYIMIVRELPDDKIGWALGIVASSGYVGLMLAPSLTGGMLYLFSWRIAFLLVIPLFLVQLFLLFRLDKEWKDEYIPIDNIGSLIYFIMIVTFVIGLSFIDEIGVYILPISIVLLVVFIKYESKLVNPIYNVKLLRNLKYLVGNYSAMVAYFVTTIAILVLTYHLFYVMDYNTSMTGLVLLITPVVMTCVSIYAGRLADRYDERMISGFALSIIFVSMVMFCFVDRLHIYLIYLACIIQGIGHGLFSSPNNRFVLTLIDDEHLGDASSLLATSKEFGKILSLGVYTVIFSVILGEQALGPKHVNPLLVQCSYYMMLITSIITLTGAALLFYSRYRPKIKNSRFVQRFKSDNAE